MYFITAVEGVNGHPAPRRGCRVLSQKILLKNEVQNDAIITLLGEFGYDTTNSNFLPHKKSSCTTRMCQLQAFFNVIGLCTPLFTLHLRFVYEC